MSKCLKSNFDISKNSEDLNFIGISDDFTLDQIKKHIWSVLKNVPFSTDINMSASPESYNDSIDVLVDTMIDKLSNLEKSDSKYLKSYFKKRLKPVPLTKVERNIQNVIKGQKLIRERERNTIRYGRITRDIFKGLDVANIRRENDFLRSLSLNTIINPEVGIVTGNAEINLGIIKYLNGQYQNLRNFLINQGFDKNLIPSELYTKDPKKNIETINAHYQAPFQMMINYIANTSNFSQLLEQSWINYESNKPGQELYNAVSAYVNIVYFDQSLDQIFKGFFEINDTPNIIDKITDPFSGAITIDYKYTIKSGNINAVNHWGDNEENVLVTMAKFSQVLISNIPIWNFNTRSKINAYLEPKLLVKTFTRLFDIVNYLSSYPSLYNSLFLYKDDPIKALNVIFSEIFNPNNKSLRDKLNELGFDQNNINYLYSFYKTVFDGSSSWFNIEQKFVRKNGLTPRYSLVSTLLSIIRSSSSMNYLQTKHNSDENKNETSVKPKIVSDSRTFDFVTRVNDTVKNHPLKEEILKKYQINANRSNVNVSIEGITYIINTNNILNRTKASASTKDLNKFQKLDILPIQEKLLNNSGLSEEEQEFRNIIEFIDTVLDTKFLTDRGLRKLSMLLSFSPTAFDDMFFSASRALFALGIYNNFQQNYSYNQFLEFWKKENPYHILLHELGLKEQRKYFHNDIDGVTIRVLDTGQNWIRQLSKVEAILEGDSSNSVISNFEGSKIPNYSSSFLGQEFNFQLRQSQGKGLASSNLLFAQNPTAVKQCVINTDVLLSDGSSKQVKSMTLGELQYDYIVNKFLIPLLDSYNNPEIYIQPTVYSDKIKFIMYLMNLKDLDIDPSNKNLDQVVENKIIETIGKTYEQIYDQVLNDFRELDEFKGFSYIQINDWLKTHSLSDLNALVDQHNRRYKTNLVLQEELHFRQISGGKLSLNELLHEYRYNSYSPEKLHARLQREKVKFIQDLLDTRTKFIVDLNKDGSLDMDSKNPINIALKKFDKISWIDGNRMILGQVYNTKTKKIRNIKYGKINLNQDEIFTINPVLNAFFMLDNLLGNNMRLSLTGSEINHEIKSLKGLNLFKLLSEEEQTFVQNKLGPDKNLTLIDLDIIVKNSENEELDENSKQIVSNLSKLYNEQIYKLENAAQNAQFKRNVVIPGTIKHFSNVALNEIGKTMNIAVIEDVRAEVFNFEGEIESHKAWDGSAIVDPFTSILENFSLQDNEVGEIKKPLHHWFDDRYATATLLKYATSAITNQWMRNHEGSNIRLHKVFKKMTNIRWSSSVGNIDLINGCSFKATKEINFYKNILNGRTLFYKDGLIYKQITNFGRENGIYYTEEQEVDSNGYLIEGTQSRVYHYFDNNSNHITSPTLLKNTQYHTIDSLYELHTSLGGIYSCSLNKEGFLQFSEASNYAVVQYMNHVTILKEGKPKEDQTQNSYRQPLKEVLINMIANKTAVKNGAGNVNPTSSFYDDSELRYITIGTDNYGIQMNSDHTADDAEMTEFTQVISSLDAGGALHHLVKPIYQTLGRVALQLSSAELDAVEAFRGNSKNKSKLYDIVARTIINNLRRGSGEAGLAESILNAIEKEFNLNSDHKYDRKFISFSDSNIFNIILPTFVSMINSKSIKRRYPGLGTVIIPSYDAAMIYDINGSKYQFQDILNKALLEGITSSETDISLRNRNIVNQYLSNLQQQQPIISATDFDPTENVFATIVGEKFNIELLNTNLVDYEIVKEPRKDNPDKFKTVLKIYLKGQHEKGSFDLVKDEELGYFSVHFKTGNADTGEIYGSTPEERNILFENLYKAIPHRAKVSTWGNVSEGGIYALDKLMSVYIGDSKLNNIVETRQVFNRDGESIEIPVYEKTTGFEDESYNILHQKRISLNEIYDYYSFTEDPNEYLQKKGYVNIQALHFQKDVTRPRNLAPARLRYKYKNDVGNWISTNIYNHPRLKQFFKKLQEIKNRKDLSNKQKKELINQARKKYNPQAAFEEITEGKMIKSLDSDEYYEVDINSIENKAAELIMSNIYKSKFGIRDGDSLSDVIEKGEDYFIQFKNLIDSDKYDLVFTNNNNQNTYITFNMFDTENQGIDSKYKDWDNKRKVDYEYPKEYEGPKNIIYKVYATTKNNIEMFEVGRWIVANDVKYENNKFCNLNGEVLPDQDNYLKHHDGRILEYVEFVSQYEVTEEIEGNSQKYTLFNINKEAMMDSFERSENKSNEDFDQYINVNIGKLLGDIYKTYEFNGIQINTKLSETSNNIINNSLHSFSLELAYDQNLYEYLNSLLEVSQKGILKDGIVNLSSRQLYRLVNNYDSKLNKQRFASFLKSQFFTASRIPAQTLQSFMQMENVGFTGTSNNQCFVSCWQTWLQGSDYELQNFNLELLDKLK